MKGITLAFFPFFPTTHFLQVASRVLLVVKAVERVCRLGNVNSHSFRRLLILIRSWSGFSPFSTPVLTGCTGVEIGFSLFRKFYVRTHVHEMDAMNGRSPANVKVELRSTFTFTRNLSCLASISFTHVNFTCVLMEKLRDSGNQPWHRS